MVCQRVFHGFHLKILQGTMDMDVELVAIDVVTSVGGLGREVKPTHPKVRLGETIGKPWETIGNHRKTIGKWWFFMGLLMGLKNHIRSWEPDGLLPSGNLTWLLNMIIEIVIFSHQNCYCP